MHAHEKKCVILQKLQHCLCSALQKQSALHIWQCGTSVMASIPRSPCFIYFIYVYILIICPLIAYYCFIVIVMIHKQRHLVSLIHMYHLRPTTCLFHCAKSNQIAKLQFSCRLTLLVNSQWTWNLHKCLQVRQPSSIVTPSMHKVEIVIQTRLHI